METAKNLIKDHCLHFIKTQNIVYFVQILHSDEYHSHIYIYIQFQTQFTIYDSSNFQKNLPFCKQVEHVSTTSHVYDA